MTVEYETLEEYLSIAKKLIMKIAPKFYSNLAKEMLRDEDAISCVTNAIMSADWKWNPDYRSKKNTVCSKKTYRYKRAIWAIKGYLKAKKLKRNTISLSYIKSENSGESIVLSGLIADKKAYNPSILAENKENVLELQCLIQDILNSNLISQKQKKYIKEYYLENKTLQEVGKKYSVSREAVRQTVNKGISTIKRLEGV